MDGEIRSPIIVVLGHVDSGKTSLLDKVRGTAVQAREVSGITQHVGSSFFPIATIKEMCGELIEEVKIDIKLPGILIVDTPGHEAFVNLRSRGASVADMAILVVEAQKGFQAQTYESLELLRQRKVPFIVALNKLDRVAGWKSHPGYPFKKSLEKQSKKTREVLKARIDTVLGEMGELGIEGERYDIVQDFANNVAVVPTSATTGEGIQDLFVVLSGLIQRFLLQRLEFTGKLGEGAVLEVKEEEGLGTTLDVIMYQGRIERDQEFVIGGKYGAIVSKVKALLLPKPLDEMRDPRDKFSNINVVSASSGIKISASGIQDAYAGSPLYVVDMETKSEKVKAIEDELKELQIETDDIGVIVKADTLGSLEALISLLRQRSIPIRKAEIGAIVKRDVIDGKIVAEKDSSVGAILGFHVSIDSELSEELFEVGVRLFKNDVIYNLVEEFESYMLVEQEKARATKFADLVKPCRFSMLPDMIFRRSKPAIMGVEIEAGTLEPGQIIIGEEDKRLGTVHAIQKDGSSVRKASKGEQVSVSIRGPTIGRQIDEGMTMYVDLQERNARLLLQKYKTDLPPVELEVLDELIEIKRKKSKYWAW